MLPDEDQAVVVAVERDDLDGDDTKLKSPAKTGSLRAGTPPERSGVGIVCFVVVLRCFVSLTSNACCVWLFSAPCGYFVFLFCLV